MSRKAETSSPIARLARAHLRLIISIVLGVAVYAMLPGEWTRVTRLVFGWNVGVAFYLVAVAVMMARASVSDIRRRSGEEDEGAFALLILTVAAAVASLGAIFALLAAVDKNAPGYGGYVALAIVTVILSWMFTHTIFALHYAFEFYGEGVRAKGLNFPDDDKPDYWDFVYFSFVIGMTFQVSDVAVTNKWIRRMVAAHGVVSFLFNSAIVALTVNMAANAL